MILTQICHCLQVNIKKIIIISEKNINGFILVVQIYWWVCIYAFYEMLQEEKFELPAIANPEQIPLQII